MKRSSSASFLLALALAVTARAGDFDGNTPLDCKVEQGRDCLPTEKVCGPLKQEMDKPPVVNVDFAKREVRSPYRTELLHVTHSTTNAESLVLQGADSLFAWSALINKTTGAMTISIADRKGAYVVFAQCKAQAK
jgi:hypothetical protein